MAVIGAAAVHRMLWFARDSALECRKGGPVAETRISPVPVARATLDLAQALDETRSRVEERFLEGGQVLAAALGSTATMRDLLGEVLAALDGEVVAATLADLALTVRRLHELPARQAAQHQLVNMLAARAGVLQARVADMQETLRYLRTVAVTVKIAGAEAAEFDGFANDMLARIQAGRAQVDGFAARLGLLLGQARVAATLHRRLRDDHARAIPLLTRELEENAHHMTDYHAGLRDLAAAQEALVRETESQVARTLSALQIGDITRQRIEHVHAGLLLLAEAAPAPPPGASRPVLALLSRQLDDLVVEFRKGGRTVAQGLAALSAGMTQMLALGRQARGGDGTEAFLPAMERSILAARTIVTRIEGAARRSDLVSHDAARIAGELADAVGAITAIRSEIQFMAINTSLRCRRLGDAGRAIVVVATELRNFAARLEDEAAALLAELEALAEVVRPAPGSEHALPPDTSLDTALGAALDKIRATQRRMQQDLRALAMQGEELAGDIGHGVARLDFEREPGDSLDASAARLATMAGAEPAVPAPETATVNRIIAQIRASYTMARERSLHDGFPGGQSEARAQATASDRPPTADKRMEEEDDLAAVLF